MHGRLALADYDRLRRRAASSSAAPLGGSYGPSSSPSRRAAAMMSRSARSGSSGQYGTQERKSGSALRLAIRRSRGLSLAKLALRHQRPVERIPRRPIHTLEPLEQLVQVGGLAMPYLLLLLSQVSPWISPCAWALRCFLRRSTS
jgi:hypothetical protein